MNEAEFPGVQQLPGGGYHGGGSFFIPSVYRISDHRISHGGHMNADLVGSAGMNLNFEKGCIQKSFPDLPLRDSLAASAAVNGHFFPIRGMPADWKFNHPVVGM